MNSKSAVWFWLVCQIFIIACLAIFADKGIQLQSNFLKLLPQDKQRPGIQQAIDQTAENIEKKIIFAINANNKESALSATKAWQENLRHIDNIQQVSSSDSQRIIYQQLFPYRYQLLDDSASQWLEEGLEKTVTNRAIAKIYNAFSGVSAAEITQDPWLIFRHYMQQKYANSHFDTDNGFTYTSVDKQHYYLLQYELNTSAYSAVSDGIVQNLNTKAKALESEFNIRLLRQGAIFYISEATTSAQYEISLIGGGSIFAIIMIFILVFRSLRPLILSFTSITIGIISAVCLTLVIFGEIHSFTLIIGSSLIGVSVDYSFHYLAYRACCTCNWNSKAAVSKLRPVLVLGLISSVVAYGTLLWTEFPGLNQLAIFSSAGLTASLMTVLLIYPILTKAPPNYTPAALSQMIYRAVNRYQKSRASFYLMLTMILLSIFGLVGIDFNDDIRELQSAPNWLKKQEAEISAISGYSQSQQWLVLIGETQSTLREAELTLAPQLHQLVINKDIESYTSVFQLILAESQQFHNYELSQLLFSKQLNHIVQSLGLSKPPQLPNYQQPDWSELSVLKLHTPFVWGTLKSGEEYSVISLKGVTSEIKLKRLTTDIEGVSLHYVARANEISDLLKDYRRLVLKMLASAFLVVLIILGLKYTWNDALFLILPPLIACVFALGAPAALGVTANLFNVIALLLIFGISIDYSLFLRFYLNQAHATLAVSLSGITTILAFGLMALSSNNAISNFGLTITSGIFASWIMSPYFAQIKNSRRAHDE